MNKDNLEQLIHDYMEKYDLLNDAEHDEIYKWNAVNHFQKYWDLDTDELEKCLSRQWKNPSISSTTVLSSQRVELSFCANRIRKQKEKYKKNFESC